MKFNMRFKNIKNRHGKWAGRVEFKSGQLGCKSKIDHFKWVKKGFGSIGLQAKLTRIFHIIFFFIKKTTCICHLESHVTNYLM